MKKLITAILTLTLLAFGLAAFAETTANAPDPEELDSLLSGEWVDVETRSAEMAAVANEAGGWDVEIVSPMTHGAYVFRAAVVYDPARNGFVYEDGKFWEVPITDSEEETELGEAKITGAAGIFHIAGEGALIWEDLSDDLGESIALERPGHRFVGVWDDDRVSMTIEERAKDYLVTINGANGASESTSWIYTCDYDGETDTLVSNGEVAVKIDYTVSETGDCDEVYAYSDGAAVFAIDGEDRLIWDDKVENAGEDRAFEHTSDTAPDGGAE